MKAVLEHLTDNDEIGIVEFGQSNRRPWGHRDREGYVAAPHLRLRSPGMDLTILSIVGATSSAHGAIGTQSIVNVGEALATNDWKNGELRLVQHEYGDSVTSTLRAGHANVLSNGAVAQAFVTFDLTNDLVLWAGHARPNGSQVTFTVSAGGSLPGLTAGAVYYVRDSLTDSFKVSLAPYGAAVSLAGGSGIYAATARPYLLVQWLSEFQAAATVSFTVGVPPGQPGIVSHTAHGLQHGSTIAFTTDGTLPTELTPAVLGVPSYYVVLPTANAYLVSATYGGLPIVFTGTGSGTHTGTPQTLVNVSGYVHLRDKFNSYDNVLQVTPYQPIEPGDYPAGVPVVPGVSLDAEVTTYRDLGLALPFAWNEGIEGHGKSGTAARVVGLVVTFNGGVTAENKVFADGFIRVGPSKGVVDTNNATTATVKAWIPAEPANGVDHAWEMHLPHWRNNPAHYTAGEGFLYPNGDQQPGGASGGSNGMTYSRPRARLTGSYVGRQLGLSTTSSAISATSGNYAQIKTVASGDLTVSIVAGQIVIQRASTTRDPTTGLIQFEDYLRAGYIVNLSGFSGLSEAVDGNFRVALVLPVYGAGSVLYLDRLSTTDRAIPAALTGTVPAGAQVTRLFWEPQHRFGSGLVTKWRMAVAMGRRVIGTTLGINSSGQLAAVTNNAFAFQGQIGWYNDDDALDWTPSNPDGNAARLKRLVEFIAPHAVKASLGTSKTLKQLAIDAYQLEADSLTVVGRELAPRTIHTFSTWLRDIITDAGQNPYPSYARIPFHWAQLSHAPWELAGEFYGVQLTGDTEGLINAALTRWVALDGFAASFDTDASPTLDGTTSFGTDPLHYNGYGAVRNGKGAADLLLPLIDFAFSFALGPGAVAVCNEARGMLNEAATITSLEPPNNEAARQCALYFFKARNSVLQRHPWTFATTRKALPAITSTTTTNTFAYAVPPDLLNVTGVFDPTASSDTQETDKTPASQPHRVEVEDGYRVLRTEQEAAVVRYTRRNVDIDDYDPLARDAFVARLASHLAGPTVQGKKATLVAREFLQLSEDLLNQAAQFNTQFQQDTRVEGQCEFLPPGP